MFRKTLRRLGSWWDDFVFWWEWDYLIIPAVIVSTILVVVLENRNPVKTIAWVLVWVFLPVIGLVFYIFFGRDRKSVV